MSEGELRAWLPRVPDDDRSLDPSSAVWKRGQVFVTDGELVRVINPREGKVYRLAGGGSDPDVAEGPAKLACFRGVSGLAIDEESLWFGDTGGGAVRCMHLASDSVSTLADGLPGPVELTRAETVMYVGCRQGELFAIDTSTAERRALESVRGIVTGLVVVGRTLYVATAAGLLLGVDRTSGKVTQRLELGDTPHSIARSPYSPWLYVGLPGRIQQVSLPEGSSKQVTGEGAVTQPRALAIVHAWHESFAHFRVTGLYFFDAGKLCWLDTLNSAVTTVLARSGM